MKHLANEGKRVRICFVVSSHPAAHFPSDPAFIYRCQNPGLYLARQGHDVSFRHITQAPDPASVDIVVFHRPRASWRLRWLLARLRRAGVASVADFDDLVFDPAEAAHSPGVVNSLNSLLVTRRKYRAHGHALAWFSQVAVSTEVLAGRVRARHPATRVAVLHNSVHIAWRGLAGPEPTPGGQPRVLAYLPGTRSHDRDFAMIAAPLARFLNAHPEVILHVTGPLNFTLPVAPEQVVHHEKVPFEQFAGRFHGVWANLAPLEDTPFNQAKSALKVLEAGYWGVPTLCSPNPDMARFAGAGALQTGDGDWFDALGRLLDARFHAEATLDLRGRVLARADVADQATGLLRLAAGAGRA